MKFIRENCGIVGVFRHKDAAGILYLSLFSLQHRGQKSAGMILTDGSSVFSHRAQGLVSEIFTPEVINSLKGDCGIGHVRYSTTGASNEKNIQPFSVEYKGKTLAIAHNGNLTNSRSLRIQLEKQ
ncbi:MAG: class II glutamine amidotransferase, partial [Candidatus Ratteibacteria bacterium]